ncbi:MAG: flagellar hook-basal body complex protein FliE [Acidaminobacteraceae bacterium]
MNITGINQLNLSKINKDITAEKSKTDGSDFTDYIMKAIDNVSNTEKEAIKLGEMLAVGETDNLQEVMVASEKANLTLSFAIEVRNKVLTAYNEINRMQF